MDFESRASDREFVGDAGYIHLEIEALHRRAREMPGQTAPGWLRGGRSRRRRADGCQRSYRPGSRSRPPSRSRAPPCAALSLRAVDCVASNPQSAKAGVPGFEALPLTFASVRRNQSRLVQLLKTILETADANVVAPVQWIEPHNRGTRMVHPRHIRRILRPGSGR